MSQPLSRRLQPYVCLVLAVTLLSSITPVMKYLFQHTDVRPIGMAGMRVAIGFVLLLALSLAKERRGLTALGARDLMQLSLVGSLGVFSYGLAGWGLLYTSVIHYILIYGLLPSFTAVFSFLMGKEQVRALKVIGIVIAFVGCAVSISEGFDQTWRTFGFGECLVLLFTIAMSAHIVLSTGLVRRFGVMTSNTVMFGTSACALLLWTVACEDTPHVPVSLTMTTLIVYMGAATAAVFFLRALSLQSLTPLTVGTFHHLVPVCAIASAYLFLGEPIEVHTMIGAAIILTGTECVRRGTRREQCLTPRYVTLGVQPQRTFP
jgi:drug/metabolite transporter (DMT)-like permease